MSSPRLIAFYLPQFHPIPENDEWWGKGFTEWRNVVTAKPRFRGHYQPHIPADLGFYDLRNEETRIAQAELAKAYGIYGFCYHHYWFNGKMLLERPFNEVLKSGKPNFPFCLCWANENWTRRWDGLDQEVLMTQEYEQYDALQHIEWLEKAFRDSRYVRIKGKPLLLIYNISSIPKVRDMVLVWKKSISEMGYPGLYVCSVRSFHNYIHDTEAISMGFDAIVDFQPNRRSLPHRKISSIPRYAFNVLVNSLTEAMQLRHRVGRLPETSVFSYRKMIERSLRDLPANVHYKIFPCVTPSWDNSARKKESAVIQNHDAALYGKWLRHSLQYVMNYEEEERIVFINAWNEWAEGCYLEPDLRNGRRFLEATAREMSKFK